MTHTQFKRASEILDTVSQLKVDLDRWKLAEGFSTNIGFHYGKTGQTGSINPDHIDFKALRENTIARIESQISALEKEFEIL